MGIGLIFPKTATTLHISVVKDTLRLAFNRFQRKKKVILDDTHPLGLT